MAAFSHTPNQEDFPSEAYFSLLLQQNQEPSQHSENPFSFYSPFNSQEDFSVEMLNTTNNSAILTSPARSSSFESSKFSFSLNSIERKREEEQQSGSSSSNPKREKSSKKKKKAEEKREIPSGFIHVRARRGQATDSHSLAERARREKIRERMKMLQDLVPGCDKVIGKAVLLDEIINYVQSLQNQVEFLSMKLASLDSSVYELDPDGFLISPEKFGQIAGSSFSQGHGQNLSGQVGDGGGILFSRMDFSLTQPQVEAPVQRVCRR